MSTEHEIAGGFDLFETKDFNFAAYLWCCPGVDLAENGVRRQGSTVYFKFKVPMTQQAVLELRIQYYNKKAKVEPLQFSEKQGYLRDLLYSCNGIEVRKSNKE